MFIIGLTGPTGSGKTTFSAMLRACGFHVADGDEAARQAVQPGSPLLQELCGAFGADILLPDGSLDRRRLADRAFASPEKTRLLNALTHPQIERILFDGIRAHPECRAAVIDAAALIESGLADQCDLVAAVLAPRETRLERILLRDGLTREQAEIRMQAQPDDAFYLEHADVVLRGYAPFDPVSELDQLLERVPR